MQDIKAIAEDIITREGGYVDDPDDPGGATKYGVTLATLRRLGLDLTGDGQVDRRDVASVS
ncbi:MAG: glycosyl hydrolase 108 family protein, partial [Pseudomonadota bacterium]|nr:glycosyl hydrolase 108 family protein [Pseudomonadota bacterium]